MRKKELLEIPVWRRKSDPVKKTYVIEANVLIHKSRKYLVLDFFYSENKEPSKRIFFDTEKHYITWDFDTKKWRTGTIYDVAGWEKAITAADHAKTKINSFIRKQLPGCIADNVWSTIYNYQKKILRERYVEKCIRETKHIDDYMEKEVKALPEDWYDWLQEYAMLHSRYLFYEYTGKKEQKAYCTHCHKQFMSKEARHNKQGICPSCKTKAIYKSFGKQKRIDDYGKALFLQKTSDGGVMLRYFTLHSQYRIENKTLAERKTGYYELKRTVLDRKGCPEQGYVFGQYRQWKTRWCESGCYFRGEDTAVYFKNMDDILNTYGNLYQYSALMTLAESGQYFDFYEYHSTITKQNLCRYNTPPYSVEEYKASIEKLIKIGMYKMAAQAIKGVTIIDYTGKNPNKILKLKNDDIKILIKSNCGEMGLEVFHKLRKKGYRMSCEQLEMADQWDDKAYQGIFDHDIQIGKTLNWLQGKSDDYITMYRDYLNGCVLLQYSLHNGFVAYPKKLREAHDQVLDIIEERKAVEQGKKKKSENAKIKAMEEKLNEIYGFEDDKYLIRAPHDATEIIVEGQKLHHCVGRMGYIERMAQGNTIILFLRKKSDPDKPYYTIETSNGLIRQVHGFGNMDKDKKEIQPFVNKFKKRIAIQKETILQAWI